MTKTTPSTSTTVQSNPLGDAMLPYLRNMWSAGAGLGGWDFNTNTLGKPVGNEYLDQMRNYAQGNFDASAGGAGKLVPGATNFVGNALAGNANPYLPANAQTQGLTGIGNAAVNDSGAYGRTIGNIAMSAPSWVTPYQDRLNSLGQQYGGLTQAGYGTYGAMNNLGYGAGSAAPGALSQFGNLASGALGVANPQEQALMANSGMAIAGNPAFSSGLRGLASGAYIDPSTNPALSGVLKSALDPITKQYQTATAPQTDSAFAGSGRYGSGAWQNAQANNQYGLGQALSGTASNIVNNAYNQGLQTTLGAGSALGQLYNTGSANQAQALTSAGQLGQQGYQLGGNLLGQGYGNFNSLLGTAGNLYSGGAGALNSLGGTGLGGASSNANTSGQLGLSTLQQMMQGVGSAANAINAGYNTANTGYAQGGNLANSGMLNLGGLAQMSPDLANYPLSQLSTAYNSLWAPIQNYAGILGQPQNPTTTTTGTQQNTQNWGSQALSGILGIASLASRI